MTVSDHDFDLLSAYHDGELDAEAAAVLSDRIAREEDLQRALSEIREVSSALKGLRPALLAEPSPARPVRSSPITLKRAAAIGALAILGGWALLDSNTADTSPLGRHMEFAASTPLEGNGETVDLVAHWLGSAPDLSEAGLRLVNAVTVGQEEVFLHYTGRNDCHLTFGAHAEAPTVPEAGDGLLVSAWNVGDLSFSLIADGMDPDRFDAIFVLLEERTRTQFAEPETLLAMRAATEAARPCA
ncbi:MAG: hypothetical protein HUJ27_00895 [Rhodobacteraceae bacterium]|nr:hypothetical protein [Paracoccaceae bacterium]